MYFSGLINFCWPNCQSSLHRTVAAICPMVTQTVEPPDLVLALTSTHAQAFALTLMMAMVITLHQRVEHPTTHSCTGPMSANTPHLFGSADHGSRLICHTGNVH